MIIKKNFLFLLLAVIGAWTSGIPAGHAAVVDGLLRTLEIKNNDIQALPQWQAIVNKLPHERKVFQACLDKATACANESFLAWRQLMIGLENKSLTEKVLRINRYVNSWPYRTDTEVWGTKDYWASPTSFLEKSGDSEDFAIFKYFSLSLAGVDSSHMRIVVARDVLRNITHAFVALYTKDDILILDNYVDAVLPQGSVLQYAPLYSVNEGARWVHLQRNIQSKITPQKP
jgi:predicted transglutaminase-like cysteine proteinase